MSFKQNIRYAFWVGLAAAVIGCASNREEEGGRAMRFADTFSSGSGSSLTGSTSTATTASTSSATTASTATGSTASTSSASTATTGETASTGEDEAASSQSSTAGESWMDFNKHSRRQR